MDRGIKMDNDGNLILPDNDDDVWIWEYISRVINMQQVRDNPDRPWDMLSLSMNSTLTLNDIDTLDLPNASNEWVWYLISKYIDIQVVRDNPDRPWDRYGLSDNRDITLADIKQLNKLPNITGSWDGNLLVYRFILN